MSIVYAWQLDQNGHPYLILQATGSMLRLPFTIQTYRSGIDHRGKTGHLQIVADGKWSRLWIRFAARAVELTVGSIDPAAWLRAIELVLAGDYGHRDTCVDVGDFRVGFTRLQREVVTVTVYVLRKGQRRLEVEMSDDTIYDFTRALAWAAQDCSARKFRQGVNSL